MHNTEQVLYTGRNVEGTLALTGLHISCANALCKRTTSTVAIRRLKKVGQSQKVDYDAEALVERRMMPDSAAKPQPDYIPQPLADDYIEACRIVQLSPKAAATLTRRCLQVMIRDFANISARSLYAEIDQLRSAVSDGSAPQGVTDETVEAIDQVRSVGNIGAHMEKDINHIVDVDAGEAEVLISLVEMLFEEWYVAREKRRKRLQTITAIADAKKAEKTGKPTS